MLRRVVAFVVFASSWASAVAAEPLSVGVGTAEITPPLGYPMSGYYHERGATGTLDPLYAKAIVFRQGAESAAIVVGDLIGIEAQLSEAVRKKVEAATGIPPKNVIVAATHSHTGPDYRADLARLMSPGVDLDDDRIAYIPRLIDGLAAAVAQANANAKPASLWAGSGREETVAFNRRGLLKDGTVKTWARHDEPNIVGPAGPTDPEVGIVAVLPEEERAPAAALVNFALHCDTVGGTEYSADYPGHIERVLRKSLGPGFVSVFATGTCGDINHVDYANGAVTKPAAEIGERLANAASTVLSDLDAVEPRLAVRQTVIDVPLQTYSEDDLAAANALIERDRRGEDMPFLEEVRAYRIRRLQQIRTGRAYAGRGSDEEIESAEGPRESLPAEVQVIRLGENAALVALPGEVFVELGLAIKERSPFEHTFVIELANDCPMYVPTRKAMEQGGYEATNSLYAAGGGEKLVEGAVKLLEELK